MGTIRLLSKLVTPLRPFDTSSPEGRSRERYRRAAVIALASMLAKGVTVLTMLVSVPLTVRYLGSERYGIWMAMSSMIAMLAIADLGLGNGLLNAVSGAHGRDDREAASRYVSSTFFMLCGAAMLFGGTFFVIGNWVSWADLLNVSSAAARAEVGPAIAVLATCFALSIPLTVVHKIQEGYQEAFINSAWIGAGSLLGLAGVLLAIWLRAGLPWLVLTTAGAPVAVSALNAAVLFWLRRPWLRPQWSRVSREAAGRVLHTGLLFLALQVAVALAYTSDNVVAIRVLGPDAVTDYSVPMRLFSVPLLLVSMSLAPLWPAYTESVARGDIDWARRTLARSLVVALVVAASSALVLVAFGRWIVGVWAGPEVMPSLALLAGLGVWTVLSSMGNAVAMFLNGVGAIRFQVVVALVMAAAALSAKIVLAEKIGVPGIIWGTVIAYAVFVVVPIVVYVPSLLSSMQRAR